MTTVIALILSSFLSREAAANESLRLSAAITVKQNILSKMEKQFSAETGIKLVFSDTTGTENYFKELLDGKADAAIASLSYEDWIEVMKKKKIAVPDSAKITHRVVGRDLMNILAHPEIGVGALSKEQLAGIFGGTTKNWKEVGGKDLPIKVFFAADKPARTTSFEQIVMNKKPLTKDAYKVPDSEMHKTIAKTAGAVAFDTFEPKDGAALIKTTSPIGRPATLITKGQPSANVQKLIDYIRSHSGMAAE